MFGSHALGHGVDEGPNVVGEFSRIAHGGNDLGLALRALANLDHSIFRGEGVILLFGMLVKVGADFLDPLLCHMGI